jgi:hypothetical protein
MSEGFLPVVDKKGLTSVNFNLKYREINCTDWSAALLTNSSGMIQICDVCTVNALTTNFCSHLAILLPLALQPSVGFGLSNNTSPFFTTYHQLSPSSHSQHLKISFYFFSPSFPRSSSSSRPFQFLHEDLFGHPILLHSLQVAQPTYPLLLYPFYYIFSFTQLF